MLCYSLFLWRFPGMMKQTIQKEQNMVKNPLSPNVRDFGFRNPGNVCLRNPEYSPRNP